MWTWSKKKHWVPYSLDEQKLREQSCKELTKHNLLCKQAVKAIKTFPYYNSANYVIGG